MSLYAALIGGAPIGSLSVTHPKTGTIFQRNGSNQASFTVSGTTDYPITGVDARMISVNNGTSTDWVRIYSHTVPVVGAWTGSLSSVNQGEYQLEIRTSYSGSLNGTVVIPMVGIGERIIPSGQSLYGCYNETFFSAQDSRARMVDLSGNYSRCRDLLTIQTGGGGSIWGLVADLLVTQLDLPVLIACTAIGGQTVADYQPGGADYDDTLLPTIELLMATGGFRLIAWGQGETDASSGTSTANYQGTAGVNGLRNIISQSRIDAGFTIPWIINLETSSDGNDATISTNVRTGQTNVAGDSNNFLGIDMDDYTREDGAYRGDGPHLSELGQTTVAGVVAANMIAAMGW